MTLLMQGRPSEPPPSLNGEKGRGKMSEELKEKILKYLESVSQARNKEVSRAIGMEKALVDKAIAELAKEGKIEYRSFGGITYIALPGKHET
jgi:Mn-dependent DtxR family transcriptional regulator